MGDRCGCRTPIAQLLIGKMLIINQSYSFRSTIKG